MMQSDDVARTDITTIVFGFAGYSGSGKTTLIEKVIPELRAAGLSVSLIKHAHHSFDIDQPGKDSYRHREAGAGEVLIASSQRWVLMHELRDEQEPSLETLLKQFAPCDIVLVEGYKFSKVPKIEIVRAANKKPRLDAVTHNIVAVASAEAGVKPGVESGAESFAKPCSEDALPVIDLNNPRAVADFVIHYCGLTSKAKRNTL
jgi:molybdopterin-guanine dinucleotide biosynthesis adapter protein